MLSMLCNICTDRSFFYICRYAPVAELSVCLFHFSSASVVCVWCYYISAVSPTAMYIWFVQFPQIFVTAWCQTCLDSTFVSVLMQQQLQYASGWKTWFAFLVISPVAGIYIKNILWTSKPPKFVTSLFPVRIFYRAIHYASHRSKRGIAVASRLSVHPWRW